MGEVLGAGKAGVLRKKKREKAGKKEGREGWERKTNNFATNFIFILKINQSTLSL